MALIHQATLAPSKLDLITAWLPTRPWFGADASTVTQVGAYRFDDPAGEVGLEAFLLHSGDGSVVHVPLTYRGAPLTGAEDHLVGVTDHSVLGTRWVYDGCGDPVWVAALAASILDRVPQAEELVQVGADLVPRTPTVTVSSSGPSAGADADAQVAALDTAAGLHSHHEGVTTVVRAGALELMVVRVLGAAVPAARTLTGTWAGDGSATLAGVRSATATPRLVGDEA